MRMTQEEICKELGYDCKSCISTAKITTPKRYAYIMELGGGDYYVGNIKFYDEYGAIVDRLIKHSYTFHKYQIGVVLVKAGVIQNVSTLYSILNSLGVQPNDIDHPWKFINYGRFVRIKKIVEFLDEQEKSTSVI